MNKKIIILLLIILLIGGFLRFYQLTKYPVHLTIDEVAVGYNSYSILKTLKDEHGAFLPLAFKSTGDWKPPILIYFLIPSIALLGLNELTLRLPIALIGVLTILLVFFLIRKISKNDILALFTSFSLAISPWHIQFSRATFEAVLALFFLILGVYLFLEALAKKRTLILFFSLFSFLLSVYTYHAERIFVPIFILFLFWIYKIELVRFKKGLLIVIILLIPFVLPFVLKLFSPEIQTRAKMTFLSQDIEISSELHRPEEKLSLGEKIFDNNFLILFNFWLKRYFNYWDPNFIFLRGMKLTLPGSSDVGLFHFFETPFFILGLIYFVFKKQFWNSRERKLIFVWLLLGPFPASLANNDQHALRSLTTIPVPHLLVGLGLFLVWEKLRLNKINRTIGTIIFIFIVFLSLLYYCDLYYIHHPIHFSEYYDYGYKEISLYVWEHQKEYQKIIVDYNFGSLGPYITGVPHLYILFYGKYDPYLYQKRPDKNSNNFANFEFRPIYYPKDRFEKNTLLVGTPWSIPLGDVKEEQVLKRVYFKNGNLGFLVVKTE